MVSTGEGRKIALFFLFRDSREGRYTGAHKMPETYPSVDVKLENVLVATDFSPASKEAVLYATAIARRHKCKLFLTHVVTSRSESALMDGWRAGQAEITAQLLANRLDGIEHELVVKSGQVGNELSRLIAEKGIDLVVVGTRGRTGVLKALLGSVAEDIFRRALCPVLTVGPNISGPKSRNRPRAHTCRYRLCRSFRFWGEVCNRSRAKSSRINRLAACGDRSGGGIGGSQVLDGRRTY